MKSYYELATMDPEAVWAYERSLGFIGKLFDAVTHADNLRKQSTETAIQAWRVAWTYDNRRQRDYARMIFRHRGYCVCDAESCVRGLRRSPQLVTYLA